ncbi:MAG: Hsp20/alpha crystallin family protein [Candidatus Promineifilaceae bacterium]|jgi:HSP20 family protein
MFRQPFNWREMEKLRRDMDRLFEVTTPRLARARSGRFPAVDVWANEQEGVIVSAELPGVAPDSIDISVTADTLTISGSRSPEDLPEDAQYHRRERYCDAFERTVQLPYTVDTEGVEASAENGVLTIMLPRAEAEKPRQIEVKTSG